MKVSLLVLLGCLIGSVVTATWIGRYQLVITSTGQQAGYVARLNRWTGEVAGQSLVWEFRNRTWSTLTPNTFTFEEASQALASDAKSAQGRMW